MTGAVLTRTISRLNEQTPRGAPAAAGRCAFNDDCIENEPLHKVCHADSLPPLVNDRISKTSQKLQNSCPPPLPIPFVLMCGQAWHAGPAREKAVNVNKTLAPE
jgi:hypothetical protein